VNAKISNILAAFETFDGTYKRDEVDAALALQGEITPYLIDVLKNVLADPEATLENPDRFGHVYALQLLGYFRESRAHNVIVDLASLPSEVPHELFGDTITESLASILFATCGGSIERIKELLLNREADEYCRSAAARALAYAVVEGIVSREEILALFGSLFTGNEADSDSGFWSFVASSACDLYPEELMPVIQKAFADGLIETMFIGLESFERALRQGKKRTLEEVKTELERYTPAISTSGCRGGLVSGRSQRKEAYLFQRPSRTPTSPMSRRAPLSQRRWCANLGTSSGETIRVGVAAA
jgi:hypothetical protein